MCLLRTEIGGCSSPSKPKQLWAAALHSVTQMLKEMRALRAREAKDLICLGNGKKIKETPSISSSGSNQKC